jgi:hypothetical protein
MSDSGGALTNSTGALQVSVLSGPEAGAANRRLQGHNLKLFGVVKFHNHLHLMQVMPDDKFAQPPGVVEVEGGIRVCCPDISAAKEEFA